MSVVSRILSAKRFLCSLVSFTLSKALADKRVCRHLGHRTTDQDQGQQSRFGPGCAQILTPQQNPTKQMFSPSPSGQTQPASHSYPWPSAKPVTQTLSPAGQTQSSSHSAPLIFCQERLPSPAQPTPTDTRWPDSAVRSLQCAVPLCAATQPWIETWISRPPHWSLSKPNKRPFYGQKNAIRFQVINFKCLRSLSCPSQLRGACNATHKSHKTVLKPSFPSPCLHRQSGFT